MKTILKDKIISLNEMSENHQQRKPKLPTVNRKKMKKEKEESLPALEKEESLPAMAQDEKLPSLPAMAQDEEQQKMKIEKEEELPSLPAMAQDEEQQKMKIEKEELPSLPAMAQEAIIDFEDDQVAGQVDFYQELEEESGDGEEVTIYKLTWSEVHKYFLTKADVGEAMKTMLHNDDDDFNKFKLEKVVCNTLSHIYSKLVKVGKIEKAKSSAPPNEKQQIEKKKSSPPKAKRELAEDTNIRHIYKGHKLECVFSRGKFFCEDDEVYKSASGFAEAHIRSQDPSRPKATCNGVMECEYYDDEKQEWVKGLHA
jgi:hypothetical protein